MKKIISLIAGLSLLSALICAPAQAEDEITVYANGEKVYFDTPPIVVQDRTLVPMRALFEALGADVTWDQNNLHAQAIAPGVLVDITIGEPTMRRSTVEIPIDVPAQIINDRTLIPLRVVSECFGMDVEWDGINNAVFLTSNGKIQYKDWNEYLFYMGELQNGVATGYGELYDKGTLELDSVGLFQDDEIVKGTIFQDDGGMYMGDFVSWLPEGNGTMYYANGDIYIGEVAKGYPWGKGVLYYGDNSFVDGEWVQGKPEGLITEYYDYYNVTYIGNYVNGRREGIFQIIDHTNNTSWYAEYISGEPTGQTWLTDDYYQIK